MNVNGIKESLTLSFIILTWNSQNYIKKCIESIVGTLDQVLSYEIFIIDNGSSDQTRAILSELETVYKDILHLILLDENMGTTYPRNLGIKESKGSYICIMDSDVELLNDTISQLIDTLNLAPEIGLAAPKMVYPDYKLQKSTDYFPTLTRKILRYFFLRQLESMEESVHGDNNQPVEVDYAISALWLLKKKVLSDVGLLDEKIFYAPEDVDYCLRIWKKGYKIMYDNSVSAVHHTQEISRGFRLNQAFFRHIKGLLYYFLKHKYFFIKPSF